MLGFPVQGGVDGIPHHAPGHGAQAHQLAALAAGHAALLGVQPLAGEHILGKAGVGKGHAAKARQLETALLQGPGRQLPGELPWVAEPGAQRGGF